MDLFIWEIKELVKKLEYHFLHQIFLVGHSIFSSWALMYFMIAPILIICCTEGRLRSSGFCAWVVLQVPQEWQGQAELALVVLGCLRLCLVLPQVWLSAGNQGASSAGHGFWAPTVSSSGASLGQLIPKPGALTGTVWPECFQASKLKTAAFLVTLSFSSVKYEL